MEEVADLGGLGQAELGRDDQDVHLADLEAQRSQGVVVQVGDDPVQEPQPHGDAVAGDGVNGWAGLLVVRHLAALLFYLYMQLSAKSRGFFGKSGGRLPERDGVAPWRSSMWRQLDLDAVAKGSSQQLLDLFLGGRRSGCCARRNRHTDLEEHLLQTRRGNGNEHPGRLAALVLERMGRADRHVGEHPGAGDEPLVANDKGDLAFEDVEAFLLTAVDVRGWPAAGTNEGFKQGVLATGVLA